MGGVNLHAYDPVEIELNEKLRALDKRSIELKTSYLKQAAKEYEKLKIAETKRGNLDGALEYRAKGEALEKQIAELLKAVRAGTQSGPRGDKEPVSPQWTRRVNPRLDPQRKDAWDVPVGGSFSITGGEAVLSTQGGTPARGVERSALAIFKQDFGHTYLVTGEIMVKGAHAGFAFAYDKDTGSFYDLYTAEGRVSSCYHENDRARRPYVQKQPLTWHPNKWVEFRIERKGNKIDISLQEESYTLNLPKNARGDRWGIIAYNGCKVVLRNVKVSK